MLEQECDIVLKRFVNRVILKDPHLIFEESDKQTYLKEHGFNFPIMTLRHIFSILTHEGFIEDKGFIDDRTNKLWRITDKGEAFYYLEDTFVKRKERTVLEYNLKTLEYSLKKKTFTIAVIAIILSLGSFIISLTKCVNDKNSKRNTNNEMHINNGIHNP